MDVRDVPQEGNVTLEGHRKAVYARDAAGKIVAVGSAGWEVEEIVTLQAVEALREQAVAAHARALAGQSSPLEYWMYARRMDLPLLAQATGIWQWRVRRHFRPEIFRRLGASLLVRYAEALGIKVEQLKTLPQDAP
jgi:hypothetical protein